jgi:general secretion pathway protein I
MANGYKGKPAGFTLIEVLVALAIIAIALLAALRAAGQSTNSVNELRARLLAGWVADNLLVQHRAFHDWPPPGNQHGKQREGNIAFSWREEIITTPNSAFRRIDVFVSMAAPDEAHVLAHLTGFVTRPSLTNP